MGWVSVRAMSPKGAQLTSMPTASDSSAGDQTRVTQAHAAVGAQRLDGIASTCCSAVRNSAGPDRGGVRRCDAATFLIDQHRGVAQPTVVAQRTASGGAPDPVSPDFAQTG